MLLVHSYNIFLYLTSFLTFISSQTCVSRLFSEYLILLKGYAIAALWG